MVTNPAMRGSRGVRVPHLRLWRAVRQITQEQLHAVSGVSRFTIQRIERGEAAHAVTIGKLAQALDVTPEQLCREAPTGGAA